MITAEECFNNFVDFKICPLKEYTSKVLTNDSKLAMIEFAKLHVEAALKSANEKLLIYADGGADINELLDKDLILNVYSLNNIK